MTPRTVLKTLITSELTEPFVFNGMINDWQATNWTPDVFAEITGNLKIKFRIGFKERKRDGAVWESDCLYEEGTMVDFLEWGKETCTDSNPLKKYSVDDHWIYADYKYMAHMFREKPEVLKAVQWDNFGFARRDGEASTLWIGTAGAHTPCHYDTYGCNLVAQIYGRKRWFLFPPSMTDQLYPTRIPYEESSVFSLVDIRNPNLVEYPLFKGTTPWVVTLEPGQVLFVPSHWWHFVESLDTSISINSWIELESDNNERLSESVCRLLISSLMSSASSIEEDDWLNPTEENHSGEVNLAYLEEAFKIVQDRESQSTSEKHPLTDSPNEQTGAKRLCTESGNCSTSADEMAEVQKTETSCVCKLCKTVQQLQGDKIKPYVKHLEPITFNEYLKEYVAETVDKILMPAHEKSLDVSKGSLVDRRLSDPDSESDYESFNESLLKNYPSHFFARFIRAATHPDVIKAIVEKLKTDPK